MSRSAPRSLRVAAVQLASYDDPTRNVRRMEKYFRRARDKGVRAICFPECYISAYDLHALADPDPDHVRTIREGVARVRWMAKQYGLWTVVGTLAPVDGAWRNMAYLITPEGRVRGTYTKIHTLEGIERDTLVEGDRLPTFNLDGVRVGLLICNDQKYFEPWAVLARKGCDVVFHPMWGNGPAGLNLYENGTQMCRAWENGLFVVTANAINPAPGYKQFALSQIIGPDGRALARSKEGVETMLVADLKLEQAWVLRKESRTTRRTHLFTLTSKA